MTEGEINEYLKLRRAVSDAVWCDNAIRIFGVGEEQISYLSGALFERGVRLTGEPCKVELSEEQRAKIVQHDVVKCFREIADTFNRCAERLSTFVEKFKEMNDKVSEYAGESDSDVED